MPQTPLAPIQGGVSPKELNLAGTARAGSKSLRETFWANGRGEETVAYKKDYCAR